VLTCTDIVAFVYVGCSVLFYYLATLSVNARQLMIVSDDLEGY